ncbi:uncharacterized protein BX664DRAFT_319010 [Halteromyces radiatus]|uniref:uncharacterized protein n=1 Tax=Halteromyces radiatus TaxID=101107 RepID=UPI00222025DE|nr:uncharacterized protein BX664DRAFT_319010 [Halteromyces radiatus]KAI8098549.1 hypothetical protein BX664DRAFT_319010 [Halteromyces radiatus]
MTIYNDRQTPKVTLDYIDWIIEQRQQGLQDHKWQQQRLRDIYRLVKRRQKELRIFFLTVDALQSQYRRYHHSQYQLLDRLTEEINQHDWKQHNDRRQQKQDEAQWTHLEKQLQHLRTYAAQRRDKKAKRERQYHDVYFVPVVNKQYKKKYMRARDKNNAVEQQLSDLHRDMDVIKDRLKQQRNAWSSGLAFRQQLMEQQDQIQKELDHQQALLVKMKQAQSFWCQFDTHHVQPYLDWLQRSDDDDDDDDDDNDWTRLRLMTVDYEEAEQHGRHTWDHESWEVTFECSHCHMTTDGWPYLNKVRTTQLMCVSCYQDNRTSMIMEKKLSSIFSGSQQHAYKQPDVLLFSRSSSIPSLISSTSKSTQSIINDCKPFVKKMKSALSLNHKVDALIHNPLLISKQTQRALLA